MTGLDLTEKLRDWAAFLDEFGKPDAGTTLREAADEIERLRGERDDFKAANEDWQHSELGIERGRAERAEADRDRAVEALRKARAFVKSEQEIQTTAWGVVETAVDDTLAAIDAALSPAPDAGIRLDRYLTHEELEAMDRALRASTKRVSNIPMSEEPVEIDHDGFRGTIQGHYVTREGKRGVVLQQVGTRVVHVYGKKWLKPAPAKESADVG